jgi:signal transduction histidine kinase
MERKRRLSIRARLTLFFVLAIALVLAFTGFALVHLVHRSLTAGAANQIEVEMAMTEAHLATASMPKNGEIVLPMQGDVVIQVTNLGGTKVWAASTAIANAPALAHPKTDFASADGLTVKLIRDNQTASTLSQIDQGQVQTLTTARGRGLIFGFVYGGSIAHSNAVLMTSVTTSFPLLLLISGGLVWLGLGLALAPIEAIRRRVAVIAAEDLSQRVPMTGGDDEIARMARTLNAMLDRLESSSKFQQEFVSNASHELRSPLTTLLATVERAANDQSNTDWAEVTDTIMREGRRLDVIIDGLFWLARHDENQIEAEHVDVDLDDLLFEESQRVRAISGLNVDTTAVQPTRVVGDPAMLKRMIRNVVDNATRYATRELHFASYYDKTQAIVTIGDDGEGIDVSQSGPLFERFVRSDPARSRTSGGTGLGLSIVTEIVTQHGGAARFVPVDQGTLMEIRIPVEVSSP